MTATVAARAAIADVLARVREYPSRAALVDALFDAALAGGDDGTRWCVVVSQPGMPLLLHGPYGSHATAERAIESGALACAEGARGHIYSISRGPRPKRRSASKTPAARRVAGKPMQDD